MGALPTVPRVATSSTPSRILLFTVPRFLPVKLVLHELTREIRRRDAQWIDLDGFRRVIGPLALQWREALERMDRDAGRSRGERLATALPSETRDLRRSLDRFLDAYVGYVYDDGRIAGAPSFLGLAAIRCTSEAAEVGVTDAGVEFCAMRNPVLQEGSNAFPPFSRDEVEFLLHQIVTVGSSEAQHLSWYLKVVRDNPVADRMTVGRNMKRFYERIWNPLELTQEMIDSTRAGIHSRCVELGLARTIKKGKGAKYEATKDGVNWLSAFEQTKVESLGL